MKLRVGVVGLGRTWQKHHRPALLNLAERFEVVGFCDPIAHRAAAIAKQWPAKQFDSYRSLAQSDEVEAVLYLSALWYGMLPILAACDAGKALYCATSLDLSAKDALFVRKRVQEAKIPFMAEFPWRQAPATLRLRELIATRLGQPRLLFSNRRIEANHANGQPRPTNMRALIEMVDWCSYLVQKKPTFVHKISHTPNPTEDYEDYQMLSLDFSNPDQPGTGPSAQITCGSYLPNQWAEAISYRRPAELQVVCEKGVAFIDLPNRLVWFDEAGQHLESLESELPASEQMLRSFHQNHAQLATNPTSLEEAYQALSIVIQAHESHLRGQRLPL